ncbi:DNA-binding protein [Aetokthonos hydrillicola Thurmond2011]|jgi:hypothetical protein|uniref:DNA-binding protein n=1 Tax=Aetokthonos hydrillicola Thurmond2011 TaxID=2712845 RepID=A0AAP5MAZ2_9CYAN|nr:DNA-binding protein [Aetokthonos hydrillicola]MBO3463593.1 hypothetical protein [Aetokthonos hydrillicola CCALA 1050]MBW4591322.1 DNA-binding protein [Aetokthonos hydrillicola CCALA 1050]MDR9896224.1 DNA-binding protein [Aetokthonos hydrillicola Thurmond2011]
MEGEKTLKEKVFEVCDYLESLGEKVTRDKVREQTGGSDREVSRCINEWKANKETAITVAGSSELSEQEEQKSPVGRGDDSVPNPVQGKAVYSNAAQNDLMEITLRGAERAAALMAGEEAMVMHFLENPDKLPPELLSKVEAVRKRTQEVRQRRSEQYDPEYFAQLAIAQFQ